MPTIEAIMFDRTRFNKWNRLDEFNRRTRKMNSVDIAYVQDFLAIGLADRHKSAVS